MYVDIVHNIAYNVSIHKCCTVYRNVTSLLYTVVNSPITLSSSMWNIRAGRLADSVNKASPRLMGVAPFEPPTLEPREVLSLVLWFRDSSGHDTCRVCCTCTCTSLSHGTCTHTYVHAHIRMYMHTYVCTCTHTHINTYLHAHNINEFIDTHE